MHYWLISALPILAFKFLSMLAMASLMDWLPATYFSNSAEMISSAYAS